MNKIYPGLVLIIGLGAATYFLGQFIPLELITLGILMGIAIANTFPLNRHFQPGISFASKALLNWGIILMGATLDFNLIFEMGFGVIVLLIILIVLGLSSAYVMGTRRNLPPQLATLIGVGSTICGASAIVAVGPVINADEEDISLSVTVISLLGILGVLTYSWLGNALPVSDVAYGIWSGSSLQGVSHALAAASARGSDSISLEVGTLVKMARVTFLAPVAFLLGRLYRTDRHQEQVAFPKYVLYFILLGIMASLNNRFMWLPTSFSVFSRDLDLIRIFKHLSTGLILLSMIAMGLKTNLRTLRTKGFQSLMVGLSVFILLSLTSGLLITLLNFIV